jgi:3-methylcrotonyl-CoA carboxylase alpha subunit
MALKSVLVANRGEIAVRIFRTCRRMGIRTIAVYSDADARALHVAQADEAFRIGPPPASESYLNGEAILSAAKRANAAAIHPGYGFLAENADFAQAVIDAALVWVGPPPSAMRALGDKARAKLLAEQQDVPLLAGYHGIDQSVELLTRNADRIGYPVLIKASAGGGGRGMRIVEQPDDFSEALQAAQREANASFGDDRVLLERYVRRPRHVEFQVLGDLYGHLVHLGERECSIQRRHQKLIEESPSPALNADLRAQMGAAALRLASAAGYANAGTVEFLLDEDGQFAFLEVNARLQVEHPVTEMITGLDLVELQLRLAAGEQLPLIQEDISFSGHAIEARVIAEDPLTGFLPSSGTIAQLELPNDVRVDTWLTVGAQVSPYYDSLLAKVISHGATRRVATKGLATALEHLWIDGVADNVDLLLATLQHPAFLKGDLHTGFLVEHASIDALAEVPPRVLAAVSSLEFLRAAPEGDPWKTTSGWRIGRVDQPAIWKHAGRAHVARVSANLDGDGIRVQVGSESHVVRLVHADERGAEQRVSADGRAATVWDLGSRRVVDSDGRRYRFRRPDPLGVAETARDRGARGGSGQLTAPMPGRVVKVAVGAGERVSLHQPLLVLEAMKMEHVVEAPHSGIVTEVFVRVGEQLAAGTRLLTLGSADGDQTVE